MLITIITPYNIPVAPAFSTAPLEGLEADVVALAVPVEVLVAVDEEGAVMVGVVAVVVGVVAVVVELLGKIVIWENVLLETDVAVEEPVPAVSVVLLVKGAGDVATVPEVDTPEVGRVAVAMGIPSLTH